VYDFKNNKLLISLRPNDETDVEMMTTKWIDKFTLLTVSNEIRLFVIQFNESSNQVSHIYSLELERPILRMAAHFIQEQHLLLLVTQEGYFEAYKLLSIQACSSP
jgi:hypothetical protein